MYHTIDTVGFYISNETKREEDRSVLKRVEWLPCVCPSCLLSLSPDRSRAFPFPFLEASLPFPSHPISSHPTTRSLLSTLFPSHLTSQKSTPNSTTFNLNSHNTQSTSKSPSVSLPTFVSLLSLSHLTAWSMASSLYDLSPTGLR